MAKPKIAHIKNPTERVPTGSKGAWTLCGLFVGPEQVDDAQPACQKCLRFRHARRWKGRLGPTKAP